MYISGNPVFKSASGQVWSDYLRATEVSTKDLGKYTLTPPPPPNKTVYFIMNAASAEERASFIIGAAGPKWGITHYLPGSILFH